MQSGVSRALPRAQWDPREAAPEHSLRALKGGQGRVYEETNSFEVPHPTPPAHTSSVDSGALGLRS